MARGKVRRGTLVIQAQALAAASGGDRESPDWFVQLPTVGRLLSRTCRISGSIKVDN